MKKVVSFVLLCLATVVLMAQTQGKDRVEVVYFHGKQRCAYYAITFYS